MSVNYSDLKVGQLIKHDLGYIGRIKEIEDERTVTLEVVESGSSTFTVGKVRNAFASRILEILPEETEAGEYEVEVEMNGVVIRMDFANFEKVMDKLLNL
jgi:hypothetical protein